MGEENKEHIKNWKTCTWLTIKYNASKQGASLMIPAYLYAEIILSIPSTFSSWYAHTSVKKGFDSTQNSTYNVMNSRYN